MSLIPPTISVTNCTDGLKVNVDASNQISISPQYIELSCDNNMYTALVAETPHDITNIAYLNILEELFINGVSLDDYITTLAPIFTGNTLSTCISDLYVHNLAGCPLLNVTTDMFVNGSTNITGNLIVLGDAILMGSGTTFHTENFTVEDNIITLNSSFTAGTPFLDAGIEVMRGDEVPAQIIWNEDNDEWTIGYSGNMNTIITSETLSGTTNYIPKFTDTHKLGNSLIYDNGTNVGIGTTSPTEALHISRPYAQRINIESTTSNSVGINLTSASSTGGVYYSLDVGGALSLRTIGTTKALITSSGAMGIGTTSPLGALDVCNGGTGLVIGAENGLTTRTPGASMVARIVVPTGVAGLNQMLLFSTGGYIAYGGGSSVTSPAAAIGFYTGTPNVAGPGTEAMRITGGNVGIGTDTPNGKLSVVGNITVTGNTIIEGDLIASTKSFVIPHPTKEGKKLHYGSLEGPEHGVYYRGKLNKTNIIELPEYWEKLVDKDSITVNLTPHNHYQKLYVKSIEDNKIYIGNNNWFNKKICCDYTVYATRAIINVEE